MVLSLCEVRGDGCVLRARAVYRRGVGPGYGLEVSVFEPNCASAICLWSHTEDILSLLSKALILAMRRCKWQRLFTTSECMSCSMSCTGNAAQWTVQVCWALCSQWPGSVLHLPLRSHTDVLSILGINKTP